MKGTFAPCSGPLDRRTWLKVGGLSLGALVSGLEPNLARLFAADEQRTHRLSRDFAIILFWANGGPSHLDTFDLKPHAPVEIWVYHPLTVAETVAIKLLEPELEKAWNEKAKPRLVAQLERHSPALARRVADATHEVRHDIPGAPGWHRVRFSAGPRADAPRVP